MNTDGGLLVCQASGIEDSTGLDGLDTSPYCDEIAPNHAVRITRPAPAARVALAPRAQGAFGAAGAIVQFNQTVRNTGEFGTDTYDLTVNSAWPTTLHQADGSTPLADTDGDGMPDTGPVAQGGSTTVVVKMALPIGASVGASNESQVTATSSQNPAKMQTARLQTGVPAQFAQTYSQSGAPKVGFYRPDQQAARQTTDPYGYSSAVATAPDGSIVQVWYQGRSIGSNRYVNRALLRGAGQPRQRDPASDPPHRSRQRQHLGVRLQPCGRGRAGRPDRDRLVAGSLWNSSNSTYNYNIYFMVLAANGAIVKPATNLTNNGSWGTSQHPQRAPVLLSEHRGDHSMAASGWPGSVKSTTAAHGSTTTWYAVRRGDGGQVKAPTQFSTNTSSYYPNLTSLADGTLFLVQRTDSQARLRPD